MANQPQNTNPTRRSFIQRASATGLLATSTATFASATLASAVPFLHTSKRRKAAAKSETIIGDGDFVYQADHQFCKLPDQFKWQTTQGVCVDSSNHLYVFHQGKAHRKDHPAIFVFDDQGKFVRAFGAQFQGGGHGIEVRKEGDQEFLYVTAYNKVKCIAKLTLTGEIVWFQKAPVQSGIYAKNEHLSTTANWSRKGFLPTNITFLDDGGFVVADGYGSYYLHQYDKNAQWVRCFGGPGKGKTKFDLAHGLRFDDRPAKKEKHLYVTDRKRDQVKVLTRDGQYVKTIKDLGFPANVDTHQNLMLIPELKSRLTLLDENDQVVARLGDGRERQEQIEDLRKKPEKWVDGQFVHPHDACFDSQGDIFVAEWVVTGRISKLSRKT